MAVKGVRENFSNLYLLMTILMYLLGYLIIDRGLSFANVALIIVALIVYYISNIFVISGKNYSLRELVLVIGINSVLFVMSVYLKIFGQYEGDSIIWAGVDVQIIFKYVVKATLIKRQRIVFLGENNYTGRFVKCGLEKTKSTSL